MLNTPQNDEYSLFYQGYIDRFPQGTDLFAVWQRQADELAELVGKLSETDAGTRPSPNEWSVKEVIGHICDTERVMAYRALWIARNSKTQLPVFNQDDFVNATDFNARSISNLVDEFRAQRQANVLTFTSLSETEIDRRGTTSGGSAMSVRALLFIIAGHVEHHIESLKTDYHLG